VNHSNDVLTIEGHSKKKRMTSKPQTQAWVDLVAVSVEL